MDKPTYIVVADSAEARIYSADEKLETLSLVQEYSNPEGRKQRADMDSDRPGVHRNDSGGSHGLGGDRDSHKHQSEEFARQLAKRLGKSRTAEDFAQLMLVAPPHFLGKLRQHLDVECAKSVVRTVNKDLVRADDADLLAHLH